MAKRSVDFKKIFTPSDAFAFIVIALGLFIALFLDEMAVRLIGVCIAILGGVALFMMVSPRLAELSMQGRPPRPSDSPLLTSETRRDSQSKRRVFEREAFVEEYGIAEPGEDEYKDEHQIELFPDADGNLPGDTLPIREYRRSVPINTPLYDAAADEADSMLGRTFGDGEESAAVRIVGVKRKGAAAAARTPDDLQINQRARQRAEELGARRRAEELRSRIENDRVSNPDETSASELRTSSSVRRADAFAKRTPLDNAPATRNAATDVPSARSGAIDTPSQSQASASSPGSSHYTPPPSAPKTVSGGPASGTTIDTPDGDTIVIRPRGARPAAADTTGESPSVQSASTADAHSDVPPPSDSRTPASVTEGAESAPSTSAQRSDELSEQHARELSAQHQQDLPEAHVHDVEKAPSQDIAEPLATQRAQELQPTIELVEDHSAGVPIVRETRRRKPDVSLNEFIDEDHQVTDGQHEPRKEFDQLLNRVLMVIRSATNARTAAFFWVNAEKQQLVVEARITEASDAFVEQRKIPLGRDAVSQIALEGRPEILTEISAAAELDLLPYYARPAGTVSFIGVPVYYGGKVVGVLCADSLVEDAYSDITVGFFGQFTKLISGLVQSYTGKFDLLQSSLTLTALQQFRTFVGSSQHSIEHILKALLNSTITAMDVRTIGAVLFNAQTNTWTVQDLRTQLEDCGYALGDSVDLTNTATGSAIMQGETAVVVGPTNEICLNPSEYPLDEGQFVAVPLRSTSMTYGALFFDNHLGTLTQQDISIAETLGEQAGTLIEQLRTSEIMQGSVLLDHATGSMNRTGFDMRMREEFARAVDYQVPLTVCLVRIDQSRALSGITAQQTHRILLHVFELVKAQLRDYDIIANIGDNLLAIGLIGYKSQQAQMWTENIRGKIASSIIDIDGRRFSVTVSIGVAEATPRDSAESLFTNALTVLARSEQQTNKVTVYA